MWRVGLGREWRQAKRRVALIEKRDTSYAISRRVEGGRAWM